MPTRPASVARAGLAIYLGLPNYLNNWRRLGFTDDDFADGGSDRFVDAIVAWGDEGAIAQRVQRTSTRPAPTTSASRCCPSHGGTPLDEWRRLAPALLS